MASQDESERDQAPLDDADTGREVEEAVRALEEGTPQPAAGAAGTPGQAESQGGAGGEVPPANDEGDPT